MPDLEKGLTGTARARVSEKNTAKTMKSGALPVFATPAMCALMEEAACSAVAACLDEGSSSVGISLSITHDSASPLGAEITATATLTAVEGKKLTFSVMATESGKIIGRGTHERVIINSERFLGKIAR